MSNGLDALGGGAAHPGEHGSVDALVAGPDRFDPCLPEQCDDAADQAACRDQNVPCQVGVGQA